jgi:polysaccharide pyruvyl transferase CsaB
MIAGAPTGCWTNAGDEAILAAMVADLRDRTPADLTVVSSNPEGYLSRYGVHEIPYYDIAQIISAARASDLMILGGGSVFFDYTGFDANKILTQNHEGLSFITGYALLATLVKKPLMMYAVGVGPLQSEIGKSFTRAAFEQAQVITVRDPGSKAMLESLGFDARGIQVTADPAFNFTPAEAPCVRAILETESHGGMSRPFVGVALREWGIDISPDRWEPAVAAALDHFLGQHNGTALFVPLHRTVDWPLTDDLGVAERVRGLMRYGDRAVILRGEYLPHEKAAVLAGCDLVLGMRLHSLIFTLKAEVPVVALDCDPKVANLMDYAGQKELSIELEELTSPRLARLLGEVYRDRFRSRASRHSRLGNLIERARQNAKLAGELLAQNSQTEAALSMRAAALLKGEQTRAVLEANGLLAAAAATPTRAANQRGESKIVAPSPSDFASFLSHAGQSNQPTADPPRPGHRRSSGNQPRVACLTNRLLDWETEQPRFGGAERYALTLGRLLGDLGFDATFYQAGNRAFEGDYFGFKVVALPPGEWLSEFACGVSNAFYEASLDYDHVIYLMPNYASGRVREDALMVCHDVWFDHNHNRPPIIFRTAEWFAHLHRAFSQPRQIVSVDTNSINVIRALWPELADRMTYLPNWVDTKMFQPPARRDGARLTVLFPRRSEIVRGAGILGQILERIRHDCRFLWWLGEGTSEATEMVKAVARRDSRLEFYAVPFYDDMPRIYHAADICVIPTVASEATSLACLEGLASGCAMVATNVGGLPNLIQPGVNGLLVDPRPEKIAAAINYLIEQPAERERLQRAGRQTALAFDLEIWRERWTAVLNELGWINSSATVAIKEPAGAQGQPQGAGRDEMPAIENARPAAEPTAPEWATRTDLYDIISFSIIDWEFRYQRPQQIMSQFADQGHRVFYLSISRHLPATGKRFEIVELRENIWEVRLATTQAIDFYSGWLPADVARFIADDLRDLRDEFYITRAVSIVQFPTWATTAYLARQAFGWPVVFDCMDNWSSFPGMESNEEMAAEERRLARSADLLVVSSETLWEKWSSFNANSLLARNAADFAHFNHPPPNTLLEDAARPIVGYFGAMAEWFDLDLMTRLAKERPDYTFVLLGDVYGASMDELESLPNVRAPGVQPYELMPAYLLHFDACIVPFVVNAATEAMDVVKFYEYISQGKPVVAPRLRELLGYKDYLYLADDADDFIRKVDSAVRENDVGLRAKRIELAQQNTWHARVKLIKAGIEKARRKATMTELLRIIIDLLHETADGKPRPAGEDEPLKEMIFHLNAGLTEREQAAQILNSRLTDREHKLSAASAEIERHKAIIAARDALVAQLQSENETLRSRLSAKESEQSKRQQVIAEQRQAVADQQRIIAEQQQLITTLQQQVSEQQQLIGEQQQLIGDQQQAAAHLQQRAAEQEQVIAQTQQANADSARAVAEQREIAEALQAQLSQTQAELLKITNTLGWRLLSRYGKVKYRYLLPVYRMLGQGPGQNNKSNQATRPVEMVENPRAAETIAEAVEEAAAAKVAEEAAEVGAVEEMAAGKEPPARQFPLTDRFDVICLPIIDWHFRFQRPQQLLTQFARDGHRVFYLNTRFHQQGSDVLVEDIGANVYGIQLPGPANLNLYVDEINEPALERFRQALDDFRRQAGIDEAVCVVQLPFWSPLAFAARQQWGWKIIYDCMDEHSGFSTTNRTMLKHEESLTAQSDLVLATSRLLYDKAAGRARQALLMPNAADFEHFNRPGPLRPLAHLPRPIIGYYGAISDWFDVKMIDRAAAARPDWQFVLIGNTFGADISQLSRRRNVHLLGEQPYAILPSYLHQFDVACIPFLRNPLTEATNPVKFYEYLSAGKPTVAVTLPELEPYRDYFYPVDSAAEFVPQIEAALAEASPARVEARIALARNNTWRQRYEALDAAIKQLYAKAAIIIISFKNLPYLRMCLKSIWAKTLYPNFEVIVVDNGCEPDIINYLQEAAKQEPRLKVILNGENLGFARANNVGLRAASDSDYVVLLNDDTVVTRGWLGKLIRYLERPEVGLVGPVTNWAGNEARIDVDYSRIEEMDEFARRYMHAQAGQSFDITMLAMYCLAMRKSLVDDIGALDEQFGVGMFEDDDFSLRARQAGYRVICAEDIFIHHWGRASFSKLDQESYNELFEENRRRFEAKWKRKWQPHKARA